MFSYIFLRTKFQLSIFKMFLSEKALRKNKFTRLIGSRNLHFSRRDPSERRCHGKILNGKSMLNLPFAI